MFSRSSDVSSVYKQHFEEQLAATCKAHLEVFDNVLVKKSTNPAPEAQIFYLKTTADYYRFLAELGGKLHAQKAKMYYENAWKLAKEKLEPNEPILLGVALNLAVCLSVLFGETKSARQFAKTTFEAAYDRLGELNKQKKKDATLVMQLLRDNISLWATQSASTE